MRVEDIPAYEKNFNEKRIDSQGKQHSLAQQHVKIPNENSYMEYFVTQPVNCDRTYF